MSERVRFTFPNRLASLYNVLHAYSVLDKLVSYCQGMNYMVAVLLMFMEEEVSLEIPGLLHLLIFAHSGCLLGTCKYDVSLWFVGVV